MTDDPDREVAAQMRRCPESSSLRLLPWATPEGKPCFLSPDSAGGVLSRLADEMETAQTNAAGEVLEGAKAVLGDPNADSRELRFALARVNEVLADVLRVAQSRGARLPAPDYEEPADDDGEGDGPRLPAEVFG